MGDVLRDEFNAVPEGLEQISEKEFVQSWFFVYEPDRREFRQMCDEDRGWWCKEIRMWWHGNTGIGMTTDYRAGTVQYWKFGCSHEWRELSVEECKQRGISHPGRCYHVEECTKCSEIRAYDSSD